MRCKTFKARVYGPVFLGIFLSAAACGTADDTFVPKSTKEDFGAQVLDEKYSAKGSLPPGAVVIRPADTGHLCLAVDGGENKNGAHVVIEPCSAGDSAQAWTLSGKQIKIFGDKCLDVTSGRDQDGAKLQIWTCAANNLNQAWAWRGASLQWTSHNRCMDLTDGSQVGGTQMQVWKCTEDNVNQKWRIAQARAVTTPAPAPQEPPQKDGISSATQSLPLLEVDGKDLVDSTSKQKVVLKGTNLGGWLVTENWMCGISDSSDGTGRFARETLEQRFGESETDKLLNQWYDAWLTEKDFDRVKALGMNAVRLPFGWRNLQHADGSWRKDEGGQIDFSRLDWAVKHAAARGIYTILDFHIWDSQKANYQRISGTSSQAALDQTHAAAIWTEVAKHFKDNNAVVAYDLINEPTGSRGNKMQNTLYQAVRAIDAHKPVIMESVSASPASMQWNNVIYSFHEYNMMGQNDADNLKAFAKDDTTLSKWHQWPVPVYIGEFMAQGDGKTLGSMIKGYNKRGYSWTNWTLKTVNMGSWGLYTFHPKDPSLDVLKDSLETLSSKIKGLGDAVAQEPTLTVYRSTVDAQ